jgi:hypothetical protein
VAIGLAGSLDPAELESLFDGCRADMSEGLDEDRSKEAFGAEARAASLEL